MLSPNMYVKKNLPGQIKNLLHHFSHEYVCIMYMCALVCVHTVCMHIKMFMEPQPKTLTIINLKEKKELNLLWDLNCWSTLTFQHACT